MCVCMPLRSINQLNMTFVVTLILNLKQDFHHNRNAVLHFWVWESQHVSPENSVSWSLGHSSTSSFHRMAFFPSSKQNFIAYRSSKVQISFLKFTNCDNQALVGCIPIAAVAVHLNLKS